MCKSKRGRMKEIVNRRMICLLTISESLVLIVSTPSMVVEPVLMGGKGVLGIDMATSALI